VEDVEQLLNTAQACGSQGVDAVDGYANIAAREQDPYYYSANTWEVLV